MGGTERSMSGYAFTYIDPSNNFLYLQTGILSPILVDLTTSTEVIAGDSVSEGPNASVDVFWLLDSGGVVTEYEQAYNREAVTVGERTTIASIAINEPTDYPMPMGIDACATANGGYVFADVIFSEDVENTTGTYVLTVEPLAKRFKTKVECGDDICIGTCHIQVL